MAILSRRRFALTVGGIAATSWRVPVTAQESVTLNGFWWEDQGAMARYGYVVGFFDCALDALNVLPAMHQQAKLKTTPELQGLWKASFDYNNIAFGQLLEGTNKFYQDFRNKGIHVRDAMSYVKNEVRGVDPSKQQANLLLLRKWAVDEK